MPVGRTGRPVYAGSRPTDRDIGHVGGPFIDDQERAVCEIAIDRSNGWHDKAVRRTLDGAGLDEHSQDGKMLAAPG
jgi:hypothetical protein